MLSRLRYLLLGLLLLASPTWATEFAIVSAAANTSTGTQDFTSSGFGTPKCSLFFVTLGTADGTPATHMQLGIGATDGTRSKAVSVRGEDATNPADTTSHESTTVPIITLSPTASTIDGSASFDSWITDGVRINWTDAPPAAYLIKVVLIGGSGVSNCYVGQFSSTGVVGNAVDITDPGFEPDVVFVWSTIDTLNDTANSNARPSFGFVVNDGASPPTQRSMSWHHTQTTIPTSLLAILDTNSVLRVASAGAGAAEQEINDFDGDGFSVYQRVSTTTTSGAYLAIQLNGISAKVLTDATPTDEGTDTITGAGFTPQFGMLLHSSAPVVDTVYTDGNSEVTGLGAFTATAAFSVAITGDDAATPTNMESITAATPCDLRKDAGDFLTCTFTAFTSDGATLEVTSKADSTAYQRAVLFIQAGASGSMKQRPQVRF